MQRDPRAAAMLSGGGLQPAALRRELAAIAAAEAKGQRARGAGVGAAADRNDGRTLSSIMERREQQRAAALLDMKEKEHRHREALVRQYRPLLDEERAKLRMQAPDLSSSATTKKMVEQRERIFSQRINLEVERYKCDVLEPEWRKQLAKGR